MSARLFYGHVMVEGVRINYYRTGGEKPPIILLHGITDNALCWNRVPLLLETEFDMVMLDARGHGSSGISESGINPDVQAGDVLAVIETLELKQPVLVGHSMGAEVAALAAALGAKLIRGVVLEDPPWRESNNHHTGAAVQEMFSNWRAGLEALKAMPFDDIMAAGQRENPAWDTSEFFQWAKAKQQVKLEVLNYHDFPHRPWNEVVRQINCPGLLLTGDPALGGIITPQVAQQVKNLWRKVDVVPIPAAGHNIHREQLMYFMDALGKFIKKLGKWKPK